MPPEEWQSYNVPRAWNTMFDRNFRSVLALIALWLSAFGCGAGPPIQRLEQLKLERTRCYGTCPEYHVAVSADGIVDYEGRWFVKVTGRRTKRLSADQFTQLRVELERANYFALRNRYERREDGCPAVWTDHPAVITSVRADGRVKTVHHDQGCRETARRGSYGAPYPMQLTDLENRIEQIIGTEQWVGTNAERVALQGKAPNAASSSVATSERSTVVAEPDHRVYTVGGEVKAPVVIHRVEPELNRFPKRIRLAGPLILSAIVGKDGTVRNVTVVRDGTTPPVGALYMESMKQWRFRPGTLRGRPVDVSMMFTVNIHVD